MFTQSGHKGLIALKNFSDILEKDGFKITPKIINKFIEIYIEIKRWNKMPYKWETRIPKIRQSISNVRFYLMEPGNEDEKLSSLIDDLWESILDEVEENELEEVK